MNNINNRNQKWEKSYMDFSSTNWRNLTREVLDMARKGNLKKKKKKKKEFLLIAE